MRPTFSDRSARSPATKPQRRQPAGDRSTCSSSRGPRIRSAIRSTKTATTVPAPRAERSVLLGEFPDRNVRAPSDDALGESGDSLTKLAGRDDQLLALRGTRGRLPDRLIDFRAPRAQVGNDSLEIWISHPSPPGDVDSLRRISPANSWPECRRCLTLTPEAGRE